MQGYLDSDQMRWGWFGGQLGCSAWMLLASLLAGLEGSFLTAMYVVVLFALLNTFGYVLWFSRRKLRFRTAVSMLLLASGTFGTAAIYFLDSAGVWEVIQINPWVVSAEMSYVLLVVVHVVILLVLGFGPLRKITG